MYTMNDERSLFRWIVYGFFTLGIYNIWMLHYIAKDTNLLCEGTGKKTTGVLSFVLLGILTLGIYQVFWWFRVADMLDRAARARKLRSEISPGTVMLAFVLNYFVTYIAGLIGVYQILNALNGLSTEYNREQRRRLYYDLPQNESEAH